MQDSEHKGYAELDKTTLRKDVEPKYFELEKESKNETKDQEYFELEDEEPVWVYYSEKDVGPRCRNSYRSGRN